MKKIISFVLVGLSILLFSCGGSKSSSVVSKYLKAESASDYETAYSLLSSSDRRVKSLDEYKEQESSEFGLLFTEAVRKSTTFKVNDSSENGDSAIVKVEIIQDDYSAAVSEMFGAAFSGASKDDLAKKGIFITTAFFSQEAINYANNTSNATVILIDGQKLTDLMIEYEAGVTVKDTIKICKIDTDFFVEE